MTVEPNPVPTHIRIDRRDSMARGAAALHVRLIDETLDAVDNTLVILVKETSGAHRYLGFKSDVFAKTYERIPS